MPMVPMVADRLGGEGSSCPLCSLRSGQTPVTGSDVINNFTSLSVRENYQAEQKRLHGDWDTQGCEQQIREGLGTQITAKLAAEASGQT